MYSTDGVTFVTIPSTSTINSTEVADSFGFKLVLDVNGNIAVNVPDGTFIYFRVEGDDVSGGGNRDEFAIDNILIEGY